MNPSVWYRHKGSFSNLLLITLFCASTTVISAQEFGFHEWLRSNSIDKLTIEINWDSLIINKNTDKEWDSKIICISSEGDSTSFKAEIASRGKYRRRICDYPPLMLDMKKKSLRKRNINDDVDEYKLVYYCNKTYRRLQLIETEAMIYKIYNLLDTHSFKIKIIQVEIYDNNGKLIQDGPAFIIESPKEFANERNWTKTPDFGNKDALRLNDLYRFALFQFLICNHDWNIDMLKNVELFQNENGETKVVPYDFDFSGWVEAPYWVARTDLGLTYPGDRYLFLDEPDFGILDNEWERFSEKRPVIEKLINDHPTLKKFKKKRILKYLDTFYDSYDRIKKGERKFIQ